MKKIYSITLFLLLFGQQLIAQNNVGIGTSSPDASAKLDVTMANDGSSKRGILIPRVALTAPNVWGLVSGTGTESMLVYNTSTVAGIGNIPALSPGYYYWNATLNTWVRLISMPDGNILAWGLLGNTSTITPATPTTYGTTAINTAILGENFAGTADGNDFVIGTNKIERMRFKTGSAGSGGNIGIGTASPTSNYLLTINPTNNNVRGGIDMTLSGMTSSANGININTGVSSVNGINVTHSSSATSTSLYGIGSVLSSTNIVSGYSGYRNSSGLSYGLYGINGTNGTYATNVKTWAAFLQGRTVISSESAPTSPLGTDLEIRNTTTGAVAPATLALRQTTALATSGNILANINFGDNNSTSPQAQIQVFRPAASSGTTDLPTAISFYNNGDTYSSMAERMRIGATTNNTAEIWANLPSPYTGDVFSSTTNLDSEFGVNGYNTATSITTLNGGIYGEVRNAAGLGVWGNNNTATGIGVFGVGNNNSSGIYFTPNSVGAGGNFNGDRYGMTSYQVNANTGGTGYSYQGTYAAGYGYTQPNVSTNTSLYHFGLHGANSDIGTAYGLRSGGVLGTLQSVSNTWGALGYQTSVSGTRAGVYGSAAYQSGSGYLANIKYDGVGGAFIGGLTGSWSRGRIFGTLNSGELLAAYNVGNVVTSGSQAEIISTDNKRSLAYNVTSTSLKVYNDGTSNIVNGKARIDFDENFKKITKGNIPTVTITAIGKSNGLYIESIDENGFTVAENNDGNSNIRFNWIAVGTRIDDAQKFQLTQEMMDANFDNNLKDFMFDDSNTQQSAKPMWWDGNKIRFDEIQEVKKLEPAKTGTKSKKAPKGY